MEKIKCSALALLSRLGLTIEVWVLALLIRLQGSLPKKLEWCRSPLQWVIHNIRFILIYIGLNLVKSSIMFGIYFIPIQGAFKATLMGVIFIMPLMLTLWAKYKRSIFRYLSSRWKKLKNKREKRE